MAEPARGKNGGGESTFTVLVAAFANLGIAVAKAVAGVISGSSAMLSEAAHSVADTVTEVLLLTSLKRSERPADEDHPLGHGPERYIWALLAAVATFVGGAVFSSTTASTPSPTGRNPATRSSPTSSSPSPSSWRATRCAPASSRRTARPAATACPSAAICAAPPTPPSRPS